MKKLLASIFLLLSMSLAVFHVQAQIGPNSVGTENDQSSSQAEQPDIIDVAEILSLDDEIQTLNQKYQHFLESIGIPNSLFGDLVSTMLVFIIFLIAKCLTNYVLKKLVSWVLSKKERHRLNESRIHFYHSAVKLVLTLILLIIMGLGILTIWDANLSWLSSDVLQEFLGSLFSVLFVIAAGIVVIELLSSFIDRYFQQQSLTDSRISTIKPIAKNSVLGIVFVMFSMVTLSQLGIDILPLLAGAGVLGIAIGFGAQALVKDIITGFIIILEDLIQVGDIVTLNDRSGTIEKITIRKVQVRNLDGTVYTIPFGEIDIVENHTKLFSYYLMKIGVAYRENIDEVIQLLRKIDKDLQSDKNFSDRILDDLEIFGLDEFGDSAVVIKARIKTQPKEQWSIGREFNRRMKIAFDENNIEIPFPHQTIYIGEDKDGQSPPLNIALENGDVADTGEGGDSESQSKHQSTRDAKNNDGTKQKSMHKGIMEKDAEHETHEKGEDD